MMVCVSRSVMVLALTTFQQMVGTGLPELTCEEDIDYLRDAFSLSMTDEEVCITTHAHIYVLKY